MSHPLRVLLSIDPHPFKAVNDTCEYMAGDPLLQALSRRGITAGGVP